MNRLCLATIFLSVAFLGCGAPGDRQPNEVARRVFQGMKASDIEYVEIAGMHVSLPPTSKSSVADGPQIERDQKKIQLMIDAFRGATHASTTEATIDPGGIPDSFTFVFRPHLNRPSFTVSIDSTHVNEDYGPEVAKMYKSYVLRTDEDIDGPEKKGP